MNGSDPSGLSSHGCNLEYWLVGNETCLTVDGFGNYVRALVVTGRTVFYGCSVAEITINGQTKLRAPEVCHGSGPDGGSAQSVRLSAQWGGRGVVGVGLTAPTASSGLRTAALEPRNGETTRVGHFRSSPMT